MDTTESQTSPGLSLTDLPLLANVPLFLQGTLPDVGWAALQKE